MDRSLKRTFFESSAIGSIFAAVYVIIALYDIQIIDNLPLSSAADPMVGTLGLSIADTLLYSLGYGAFLLPVVLLVYAHYSLRLDFEASTKQCLVTAFGSVLVTLSLHGLFYVCLPPLKIMTAAGGGVIGFIVADGLLQYCNRVGAVLVLFASLFMGLNTLVDMYAFMGRLWHMLLGFFASDEWSAMYKDAFGDVRASLFDKKVESEISSSKPNVVASEKPAKSVPNFQSVLSTAPVVSKQRRSRAKTMDAHPPVTDSSHAVAAVVADAPKLAHSSTDSKPADTLEKIPPLELVHMQMDARSVREDPARIAQLCKALEARLLDYGVQCKVLQALTGPVITRYELDLAAGTKASKVTNLAKDLARSLSVPSVRVIEVIPGKTCIGIEIPNHKRQTVGLHEVLESANYQNAKARLTLALGVDISGEAVVADLAKMPHLLVAGTTGSGKSVGINGLLLSLLFKSSPDELRLILIDPKMLELAVYDGIAHLLTPVVTDMRDAASALHWCVNEMERRYKRMSELGVRNIDGYNTKAKSQTELENLPHIVVIVDEFADMMMMVGKKVEQLIARLAQKARAAGIHLILATQRPSVDVITGLIKANIPTRIAYQVSSKIDSRTIIDQQGAEALLGAGDMLYLAPGSCVPVRAHSAYITDKAVLDVVAHLKRHAGAPTYVEEIVSASDEVDASVAHTSSGEKDNVYDEAVAFVIQSGRASISGVQRRFRIGYNRAATLVERMEAEGVVSSMDNSGQRTVLAKKADGAS